MGWFKKVFRKSKGKKRADQSTEKEGQNDASDHGNEPEPEVDHRQPEENKDDPEENKDEGNMNLVAPTSPDGEPPPHRPYEPDYQPWSIYGPGGWYIKSNLLSLFRDLTYYDRLPAGYHQQEDYHRVGHTVYVGEASGQQNLGSFSHPPRYIGHGDRSSVRYTGCDHFAGSSGQVNNYGSPPRMLYYDRWNLGQCVESDRDVWTSDYWQGLFKPPHGGWS